MTQKQKKIQENNHEQSRLEKIRSKLSPLQRKLLNEFWQHYRKHTKWPLSRSVNSQHGKQAVRDCLKELGGDVVHESQDSTNGRCYELSAIGVLLTDSGQDYFSMLTQYLEFLRAKYKEVPDRLSFTDKDFRDGLNLTDEQTKVLGGLARFSGYWDGYSGGAGSWSINVPDEVEDLPENGPLDQALEGLLFRRFQEDRPVSIEERQRQQAQTSAVFVGNIFGGERETPPSKAPVTIDALKRRYQVFVSSTYEDLKEERQHVIQALLETKCIPLGMELFPAASVEQWDLIKRVIDECDYYLVVIAGRYGSLSKSQTGYTEMEFDYAMSIGKPVIGFYHKSPEDLPGTKLEKTDEGRKRLKAFSEKVRKKLCRPWGSSAELGSAVKSAILNELEFNPKPGWIRADVVPSSDAVEKLKQKIADLEEKLKQRKALHKVTFPHGQDLFTIPIVINYDYKTVKLKNSLFGEHEREKAQKQLSHELQVSWDDLILMLQESLQKGSDLDELETALYGETLNRLLPIMVKKTGQQDPKFEHSIPKLKVKLILQTLTAKKIIKMIAGKYGSWSDPCWRLTPSGLQYMAELQAIKGRTASSH